MLAYQNHYQEAHNL